MKQSWLSWFLRGALLVTFLVLFSKVIELGVIKGNYFRTLSQENRIRHITLPAPRGKILARGGEELAGNTQSIKSDVTTYQRIYTMGEKFAHASGYVSEAGESEVGKINPKCPEKGPVPAGSLVGKTGLEEEYECVLSGINGEELIEVDTLGKKIRTLGKREPTPGRDIKTNIDFSLQEALANEMDGKPGAGIITDTTGAVFSIYSSPSFDPNLLAKRDDPEKIASLLTDSALPFFNRAVSGLFHPGSVFKPITAVAALEGGVIDKNFVFDDPGAITVNGFSYNNWFFTGYGRREGLIGLARAIARSTDTLFYKIGEMAGPDAIARWAGKLGANKITGIDIPGEKEGLVPTPSWKKKVKKEAWFLGNTYNMSIGQGDVALTPIEVNYYISAIASGGGLCRPSLLSGAENCSRVEIKKENLDLVKEGMKQACETGGTAYTFFDFAGKHGDLSIGCKT